MTDALAHRGPDDAGAWADEDAGIVFGHRRLSILDLSPAGHQPMASVSGRYVIVFNGEIYNHRELRARLESHGQAPAWRGQADTETLLAAIEAWGFEKTLTTSTGMFAFAVWDRQRRALTLARDRLGEKPLYYGWQGQTFLFGSELAALKAHPAFRGEVDRDALTLLLRYGAIHAPRSIYRGIAKLPPGTLLTIAKGATGAAPRAWWTLSSVVEKGLAVPFQGKAEEAVDALEKTLGAAVERQCLSDVPLGAFLSGGVDSSTVAALMQARSPAPIRTFSIGFDEQGYDESAHAAAVARHLGTDHTAMLVTPDDALALIPELPRIYSEPFADSSQLPTALLSRLTRGHVTVSLSGDGGDELFGGYNRYVLVDRVWRRVGRLPRPARLLLARAIRLLPPDRWTQLTGGIQRVLPAGLAQQGVGEKLHKAAGVVGARSTDELYASLISQWPPETPLVLGGREPMTMFTDPARQPHTDDAMHRMMALDTLGYLPDDILTKVDRAAMASSLETRVPMLDPGVVELAWRLPMRYKLKGGIGKWPLRQVLYRHVPRELIERPKMGFGVPIGSWLRGPLREWAEDLLDPDRLHREGYLYPAPIRHAWDTHLSGRRNLQHGLWNVLMFQAWLAA
jgi:asparagine synthase (glutamine-hydrolysing)